MSDWNGGDDFGWCPDREDSPLLRQGTVVPLGLEVPEGSLVAGVPGKVKSPCRWKKEIL